MIIREDIKCKMQSVKFEMQNCKKLISRTIDNTIYKAICPQNYINDTTYKTNQK